jgi:predicted nucleotidyltransferase
VFGSALRGDDAEGSDFDWLVDPTPGVTLFDLGGIQDELEQLFGIPVDVVTPKDLPATFLSHMRLAVSDALSFVKGSSTN